MQEQAAIFRFLISKDCLKRIKLSWTECFKESPCYDLVERRTGD